MREFFFAVPVLLAACSSTSSDAQAEDTGTVPDTAAVDEGVDVAADTAPETTSDVAPETPDYSGVNPVEGVTSATKVAGMSFSFTEGTTWNAAGFLLFSDVNAAKIWKLTPPSTFTEFRPASGNSNGLAFDLAGRLLACEQGNRRVSRSNGDGSSITTVVDSYEGKRFNSPNDLIVRSDGNIYFTDPDYGLAGRTAELGYKGIFRVDPSGAITLVDKSMNEPNGIAFSPDEKTLYVGDTGSPITNKWTVGTDGVPTGKTKFVDAGSDGMAIDDAGNVYLSSNGAIKVFKPNGDPWGTIAVAETPTNCAFGGADRKTLFISAQSSIYSVQLKIPGKG